MSWESEAVPAPSGFWEMINGRDTERMAIETFSQLDNMRPVKVPRVEPFQDPGALRRWRNGAPMDENLVVPFAAWLRATTERAKQISENERRLRSTVWAHWRLRGTDYEQHFVEFHRREWGLEHLSEDSGEREEQVQALARYGEVRK